MSKLRREGDILAAITLACAALAVGGIYSYIAQHGSTSGAAAVPKEHAAETTTAASDEPPLAYKVAVVDDDLGEERRVDVLLDEISARYKVTRLNVADMSTHCKEVLKDKGISESDLSILEHVNHIGPAGHSGKDLLAMVFTQYLLDRDRSYSPDEATRHVQAAITAAAGSGLAD